jgi:hypothetical protein
MGTSGAVITATTITIATAIPIALLSASMFQESASASAAAAAAGNSSDICQEKPQQVCGFFFARHCDLSKDDA